MKNVFAFLTLAAALIAPSHAAVVYTSQAAFATKIAPGSYTETFTATTNNSATKSFTNGTYSYTISAGSGNVYNAGQLIGASQENTSLRISFTGAAVTAFGGNFFVTTVADSFMAVPVFLTLSDGTSTTFTPTSFADSFRGFTSNVGISSLTFGAPGAGRYATLDNFVVGRAVPEPGTMAIMAVGLAGLFAARRRRAA